MAIALAAAACIGYPAVWLLITVIVGVNRRAADVHGPSWALIARTLWVSGFVGAMATCLAVPVAWACRRLPRRAFLFLLLPMFLPSYLAYAGWGLLRAPNTPLGEFLLRGPPGATPGGNWYPVAASAIQAHLGLILWSWPIAALILAAAWRRFDESTLDALRLEPIGRLGRGFQIASMSVAALLGAFGAVALVMLGSAVPLHVAQFDTLAIGVWRALDETSYKDHWTVWIRAWPLLVIAGATGVWLLRRLRTDAHLEANPPRGIVILSPSSWVAAVIWTVSVLVPFGLLIANLRSIRSLVTFVRVSVDPIRTSLEVAAAVACLGAVLIGATWIAAGARGLWRAVAGAGLLAFLVAGLSPGVLLGSAAAHAWNHPALAVVYDTPVIVVLCHLARFGFLACMTGMSLARAEGGLRDMRSLDAGDSLRGWLVAAAPPQLGVMAGMGVAMGLLSLHEIETTIMVQPPSAAGGGLAWKLLQALHFNREDDLIPAMVFLVGTGLVIATISVLLAGRGPKADRGASQ